MRQQPPILIVEDEPMIREGLQEFLEGEGFSVQVAANGKIGMEILRTLGEDTIVLLDLQMPVMTGEQFLETLSAEADARLSRVRVIVLTARVEGLEHPSVAGIVKKPLELDDILTRVRKLSQA